MIEEAKNIFVETAGSQLFTQSQNFQSSQQITKPDQDSIADSIYLHLSSYWLNLIDDPKNLKISSTIYMHALNTIKSMLLTSGLI